MNTFDPAVPGFLNRFTLTFRVLDKTVVVLSTNQLLKGGVLIALIWWLWFRRT